jgi:hypothetical protein
MSNVPAVYSAAKIGKRYFWVLQDGSNIYDPCKDALAEGFAPTKEDAMAAIGQAAKELGVEATEGRAGWAASYKKYWRDGKDVFQKHDTTKTAMFQGLSYIWRLSHYDYDNKDVYEWEKEPVARVTNKYVFIYPKHGHGSCMRLDRAALERAGHTTSRAEGWGEDFYTETGRQAKAADMEDKERRKREEQAKWAEKLRVSLIGKECVFCSGPPDYYTNDKHPTCEPCCRKARGYYRVPANVIIPKGFA